MDDLDVPKKRGRPAKQIDTEPTKQPLKRVYKKQQLLDHDLFKLEPAGMQRNVGYNEDHPIYDTVEHSHYYHTIDSRGAIQNRCTKIAGHFHEMIEMVDGSYQVSGPMVETVRMVNGRRVKTVSKVADKYIKYHTHDLTYLGSEKIKPAVANVEWAKVHTQILAPETAALSQRIDKDIQDND